MTDRTIKTIIFDLDGTLLDTLADLAFAFNQAIIPYGGKPVKEEAFKLLVGNGARNVVVMLFEQQGLDSVGIDNCLIHFRKNYLATSLKRTRPYPGIPELLDNLAGQGITLSVLSNKPHKETELCIRQFFKPDLFQHVWGHQEQYPLKPDPGSVTAILDRCGASPREALFIGDSMVDMQTAVNAGIKAIGVTWGFRSREELLENGAEVIVDSPNEILEISR